MFPMHKLQPVSQKELIEVINSIKPKPSTGIDGISAGIVKYCRQELLLPLLHVIQLSLAQGNFPSKMKTTKIIPLHKKGSRLDIENYRPISLIPTFSKILEKIVLRRLLEHLSSNELLTDRQHGFVKGKSTTTALIDLIESVIDDLDSGNNVVGIFVDMSKAFDCLSHDLIISKLSSLGICGMALGWFTQYLKGRAQLVELSHSRNRTISTVRSEVLPVSRGVPQGSVLGPVLYILATNDLPDTTEPFSRAIMYADDTALLSSSSSVNDVEVNAYIGLSLAAEYCDNHDLVFNASKTKQVSFGSRKNFVCSIPDIDSVESVKHLGVIIDGNLAWNEHIDALCRKLSAAIFALRRTVAVSTEAAALTAYYALFESVLCYGIVVWGGSSAQNLNRVLLMQKRAVRTLSGIKMQDSCRPEFVRLKILTVVNIFILQTLTMVDSSRACRHHEVHSHNTRRRDDYNLPAHNTRLYEEKPSYMHAKFFNALPVHLKSLEPRKLKKELKCWLSHKPFYSIAEYLSWQRHELS